MAAVKRRSGSTRSGSARTPWSYRAGAGFLHRVPAGIKLLALPALSASPALGSAAMAGTAALILLGAFSAGIRPRELFTGSRPLMVMVIFTAVIKICKLSALLSGQWAAVVSVEELTGALRLSAGILISFTAGSLLFAVTTMTEIRHSLERAEHFLFRSRRLSLALALMLAFLPRFFELWEAAETAAKARGCTGTFRRVLVILPLVTERMIESAAETAAAMEARGVSV